MDRTFTILAGKHYSEGWHFRVFLGRTRVRFEAVFARDCLYVPVENPGQINKLFGLAFGRHHNASGRIGWRSDGQRIELVSYVYTDRDIRMWRSFGMYDVEKAHRFEIQRKGHDLSVEMETVGTHHYHLVNPMAWGYWLYPYFGGLIPAPHDMHIRVRVLDCDGEDR